MKYILLSLGILLSVSNVSRAQNGTAKISGKIIDDEGVVPSIAVYLKNTSYGAFTNSKGEFELKAINPGSYVLVVQGMGYKTLEKEVLVRVNEVILLDLTVEKSEAVLNEIIVFGKSAATELREEAYAIEVVDASTYKNLSTSANDLLGRISGVNIRQSGGVGSSYTMSLNGLSGKQVRIFIDGIPMDYFGRSLQLNNFSANLIERIEVYKGVVPIHLSSDALGGAVNVVTTNKLGNFLDASYGRGSYGWNSLSINAQLRDNSTGLTTRFKSFYNQADNNYKVPIHLVDFETGKEETNATLVERFHDGYSSQMGWIEAGFTGVKAADQLMVGVLYSDNTDEVQQPENAIGEAKIPFGEVRTKEEKWITTFNYNKNGFLTEGLNIKAYLVAAFAESNSQDTSSFRYDWFGNKQQKIDNTTGELENRKTLLTLKTDNYLSNVNAEYQLTKVHNVALNYSLNFLNLEGHDPFKQANQTQFNTPSTVLKQVFGGSYSLSALDDKLKATAFTKYYLYDIESLETNYQGTETLPFKQFKENIGFGLTAAYKWNEFQVKLSYENAMRFPEVLELFGNGLNYEPNPTLQPEESSNYNAGVLYNATLGANAYMASVNLFVRDAKGFIIPQARGIKVSHINNGRVLSKGIDLSSGFSIRDKARLTLNATYLDLRDNNKWRNGNEGTPNSLYKIRIPNVPYLFGNFSAAYHFSNVWSTTDRVSITVTQNYVHSFFYRWENLASQDKGLVPTQWTTSLESVYSFHQSKYNLSLSINNLWDAKVYDNYQQLRPGRTFNLKFRYLIN